MSSGDINEKASEFVGLKATAKKGRIDFSELAIHGLKKSAVEYFLKTSKLRPSIFYRYLDITPRALGNYRANQVLRLYLTDRILDLAKLYAHGLIVFGSTDHFNYWLNSASVDLNGEKPIDLIHSRHGLEYVDDILGRIEHGIPA
jgi:putative toxin-antitoxin system antitoxin component (TIGR02293 family)